MEHDRFTTTAADAWIAFARMALGQADMDLGDADASTLDATRQVFLVGFGSALRCLENGADLDTLIAEIDCAVPRLRKDMRWHPLGLGAPHGELKHDMSGLTGVTLSGIH